MHRSNHLSNCNFIETLLIQYQISCLPYVNPQHFLFDTKRNIFIIRLKLNCTTNYNNLSVSLCFYNNCTPSKQRANVDTHLHNLSVSLSLFKDFRSYRYRASNILNKCFITRIRSSPWGSTKLFQRLDANFL